MSEANTSTVPSSFAAPPRVASQFRDRFLQSEAGQEAQPTNATPPSTPPVVESNHVAAPGSASGPLQPNPLEQPFVDQPQPGVPQTPPAAPAQPQPGVDPSLVRQLAQERDALWQQVNQLASERQAWLQQQQQQSVADRLMQAPELQELESVDPEDARRIASAAISGASSQFTQLQQELNALRAEQQRSVQEMYARERAQFDKRNADAVLQQHPDFFDLYQNSAEFRQFLNGRDGYSSKTREQMATEEFYAGNPAFVVDLMNRFKAGRPNVQNAASVAPVQVAGAATAAPAQDVAAPSYTLSDLNNLMQTRQISQDQYREMLKELRAANSR